MSLRDDINKTAFLSLFELTTSTTHSLLGALQSTSVGLGALSARWEALRVT